MKNSILIFALIVLSLTVQAEVEGDATIIKTPRFNLTANDVQKFLNVSISNGFWSDIKIESVSRPYIRNGKDRTLQFIGEQLQVYLQLAGWEFEQKTPHPRWQRRSIVFSARVRTDLSARRIDGNWIAQSSGSTDNFTEVKKFICDLSVIYEDSRPFTPKLPDIIATSNCTSETGHHNGFPTNGNAMDYLKAFKPEAFFPQTAELR